MSVASDSPYWPVVKNLYPRLRMHIRTFPQDYRGERWYVLMNEASGNHLRFNLRAYKIIGRLDGDRTVEEIWQQTSLAMGEEALSQDEVIQIITHLFSADILHSGIPVAAQEFFDRYQSDRNQRRKRVLSNPLSLRIPLIDPDKFLNRSLLWIRPLFSQPAASAWIVVVALALLLTLVNIDQLIGAVNRDVLRPSNLMLMGILFVFMKVCHEFGHAYAVKLWGGEVHEMGITLLVLMPVPYVDASAAWTFRERKKRVLVGAVGIVVELFLASLALFIWLAVEPGIVREAAFNVFLIGAVSTIVFNANPLLRFDGYFILQDLIEIPNLSSRSSRYYLYLVQRYLFGIRHSRSPATSKGERRWFLGYAFAAFFYRLFVLFSIVIFLAQKYLIVGVALGTWSVFMQILLPLFRGIRFLIAGHQVAGQRPRASAITTLIIAITTSVLFFFPFSLTSSAQGIIWVPDQAQLYVATDGFVSDVVVPSGGVVKSGQLILRMRSPELETQIAVLESEKEILMIQRAVAQLDDLVQAGVLLEKLTVLEVQFDRLKKQKSALHVYSVVEGVFVIPSDIHLQGRYLRKGELLGYVINSEHLIVKSVLSQADIGLLLEKEARVTVRFAERMDRVIRADIISETPAGSKTLPSMALGAAGGGDFSVETSDDGLTATEKVFQVDLALPDNVVIAGLGGRVYVRFDYGKEPLAYQWLRSGRQLLLSRLSF